MGTLSKYLMIVPVALLVTFSQLLVKWRTGTTGHLAISGSVEGFARFIADPVILFAYGVAFIASMGWLYVVARLPLSVAFPVYMGLNFLLVLLGGWAFLAESVTPTKIVAVLLILAGMALAMHTDA